MSFEARETSAFFGAPQEFYRFTMGSSVWRVTSGDREETIDEPGGDAGVTYSPLAMRRSGADYSREDTSQNLEITIPADHPVALLFTGYTPPAPVGLVIFNKHRTDPEILLGFTGTITSARFAVGEATLIAAPANQNLKRAFPSLVYQSQCNWALYGPGCGVDQGAFTDAVTLTTIEGITIISADFTAHPDGWYTNGWLELPDGQRRYIVSHVGDTVTLIAAFPSSVESGATASAIAGCMRDETTCDAKFGNLPNHLGFPRVPGRNPHGGGAIA